MATAADLIRASLREIGVLAAGEAGAGDDLTDGLDTLNRMLDQWAAERLMIYTFTRTTWTITASDGRYSVGASGDVNVARPTYIHRVNFIDTSTDPDTEYPLQPHTEDSWAAVRLKAQTSNYPTSFYYNPTFPTGTLDLWPVPTATTLTGALYAPQAVAQLAALTTSVALPPGYSEAIVKNLALKLLPSYERQPNPLLVEQARNAVGILKRVNKRLSDAQLDAAALIGGHRGRGSYSIYQE